MCIRHCKVTLHAGEFETLLAVSPVFLQENYGEDVPSPCPLSLLCLLTYSFLHFFPVPSGPPQSIAIVNHTTTSITLSWRDPAPEKINDRDGVTGFVVRRNRQQVANITGRTYTVTGLSVGTSYTFEVLAVNDQGRAPKMHAARLSASTADIAETGMQTFAHIKSAADSTTD